MGGIDPAIRPGHRLRAAPAFLGAGGDRARDGKYGSECEQGKVFHDDLLHPNPKVIVAVSSDREENAPRALPDFCSARFECYEV